MIHWQTGCWSRHEKEREREREEVTKRPEKEKQETHTRRVESKRDHVKER